MEAERLFRLLKEHKVDFVIIGATAFPVHGYARATFDIDIFIKSYRANAEKTWQALKEFGYDMTDISIDDLLKKKLLIRQYAVEADIHPFVKGVSFDTLWKNKVRKKVGKTFVYFASLDDLIKMKKAAGRAKDMEDLKMLRNIKKLQRKDGKKI